LASIGWRFVNSAAWRKANAQEDRKTASLDVALHLLGLATMPLHTRHWLPFAALALFACSSTSSAPSASAAAHPATSLAASVVVTPVAAPSLPPVAGPELLAESRKGIAQRGPSSFDIARATMGQIIDNQPALMSQSRIVPETDQGKVVGVRVFGVTPDSTLGALGIKNGDRVERIDGTDMTSPDKAIATFASLRTADHFTVVLDRAGQDMNIDYAVK
jgi:general secretion pathway protein C